jgi:UDP-glucose 4-epimerase
MKKRAPKSLVLGACGFVGSHLCEVLAQAGHDLIAFDAPSHVESDSRRAFPSIVRGLGVQPREWGPSTEWAHELSEADFVFLAEEDPGAGPMKEVLAMAGASDVRKVVLLSDALVYGERCPTNHSEEVLPDPTSPRARRLLAAEEVLRAAELCFAILRPAGLYGPRGQRGLREAARPLQVWTEGGDGPAPFLHVRDLARAALHVAVSPQATDPVYNVGDASRLSAGEAARLLARLTGHGFLKISVPRPLYAVQRRVDRFLGRWRPQRLGAPRARCDVERLQSTGFRLEYPDATHGLRDTVAWYKQEGWLA